MKLRKMYLLSLVMVLVLSFSSVMYAFESSVSSEQDIMDMEGPTVVVDLGEYGSGELQKDANGDYSGQITPRAGVGVTAVSCVLSGYTGGIPNLYEILIKWTGTNQVVSIKATTLTISSSSSLYPDTYRTAGFSINCGSTTLGYRSIGTCYIPTTVKQVRIKTTGLSCYFNDRTTWLSTGNIDGPFNVN